MANVMWFESRCGKKASHTCPNGPDQFHVLDICFEFHYTRGGWAREPPSKIMKNGNRVASVLNKGGTKAQGGQLEYCLTYLEPQDVITIELDGEGLVK